MIIKLTNGFFIEIDEMNYTLKQNFIGKGKDEKPKTSVRVIGYFSTMDGAIKRYITVNQTQLLLEEAMEMEQYVKSIEKINNDALRQFKSILEVVMDDGK